MDSSPQYTRRDALLVMGAMGVAAATKAQDPPTARPPAGTPLIRNDDAVRRLLASQIVDPTSPWRGSSPDQYGLHTAGSAASVIVTMAAAFVHAESAFHGDKTMLERIGLAAAFLERSQSPDGNVDLLVTNFNSPPDTGFITHHVATAASICRRNGQEDITRLLQPFLVKAGGDIAIGCVHTPNHRWVFCAALAQIH